MERELGAELSAAISLVNHHFVDNPDWSHPTARIVRLHLWSALHDRPTCWACDPRHWPDPVRPRSLPSQPTMSRRLRSREFEDFMRQLEQRLSHLPNAAVLFKRLDSKPLTVPAHSTDPHARSRPRRGTEIQGLPIARHRLRPSHPAPAAGRPHGRLRAQDRRTHGPPPRRRRPRRRRQGLRHQRALRHPRPAPTPTHRPTPPGGRRGSDKGLGHRRHSPHRLRCKDMLEGHTARLGGLGLACRRQRTQVERDFAHLTSFGGGLTCLPPWVRTHPRVRRWVWAKLLINAARLRRNSRCRE